MWKAELLTFRVGFDIHPGATDIDIDGGTSGFARALQEAEETSQEEGVRAWVESRLMEET